MTTSDPDTCQGILIIPAGGTTIAVTTPIIIAMTIAVATSHSGILLPRILTLLILILLMDSPA
jgi:hypothetical protein